MVLPNFSEFFLEFPVPVDFSLSPSFIIDGLPERVFRFAVGMFLQDIFEVGQRFVHPAGELPKRADVHDKPVVPVVDVDRVDNALFL